MASRNGVTRQAGDEPSRVAEHHGPIFQVAENLVQHLPALSCGAATRREISDDESLRCAQGDEAKGF